MLRSQFRHTYRGPAHYASTSLFSTNSKRRRILPTATDHVRVDLRLQGASSAQR